MSPGASRRLAARIGRMLDRVYPAHHRVWVRAMRTEIEQVAEDREALLFALGCLWGGCLEAARHRLQSVAGAKMIMNNFRDWLEQPRFAGLAAGLAATCLGMLHLAAADAPARYLVVNATAFLLGAVALSGLRAVRARPERHAGAGIILLALCLLVTGLAGSSADGASRWIWIGALSVQVSLVVLPLMIASYARFSDALGTGGIGLAAAALALQPDRAMAGVLALSMAALALAKPGRMTAASALIALAAFAATLARPDGLAAVPYVDRVLYTAFDIHVLAGIAVLLGLAALLVPAAVGWRRDPEQRAVYLVFAATWLGCILAAALGNYPTPVVGYGGSAILGYLLSLSILPARAGAAAGSATGASAEEAGRGEISPRSRLATHPAA